MTTFLIIVLAVIVLLIIVLNQKIISSCKKEDLEQDDDSPKITNINRSFMQSTIAFLIVSAMVISWLLHLSTRGS